MKIKLIPIEERTPVINEPVLAINNKGFIGIGIFDGEKWNGQVCHWIEFEKKEK